MSRAGHKYRLVLYTRTLDGWRSKLLTLGLALAALAWGLQVTGFHPVQWRAMAVLAAVVILVVVGLLVMRKAAYVQPHPDHLRLVTPLFHLRISYRRVRRAGTATIHSLFPPQAVSARQRSALQPLSRMTALVVELTSDPLPRLIMRLLLSPLYFKDRTPHIVLLVQDWMKFSDELESFRGASAAWATRSRFSTQQVRYR